jgi:tRNA(fMet)-specific endonuclease VapC
MTLRYLLDTMTLSEPMRGQPHAGLIARLSEDRDDIATAAPTLHELIFGARLMPPSRRRQQIELYIRDVVRMVYPILPYDAAAAEWHAAERARLVRAGRTPTFVDGQIAAIAAVNGLVLVTSNVRDFENYTDLAVADWRA